MLIYKKKKKQRDLERKKKNTVEGKEGGGSKTDGNGKNKEAKATVNERKRTCWKEEKVGGDRKAMAMVKTKRRRQR